MSVSISRNNLSCLLKINDCYYLKNLMNGCIIELNNQYYNDIKNKKTEVSNQLEDMGFFKYKKYNSLELMIMMSSDCNLKCEYCFETNKRKINLNDNTMKKIIDFVKFNINEEIEFIDITYTGGEPLLNFEKIVVLSNNIKMICNEYNVRVYFSIITNGTLLTKEHLVYFNDNGFSIQITLDGDKQTHDLIRFYDNREGTFDDILNIIKTIQNDYKYIFLNIRINICNNHFKQYENLIEYLIKEYSNIRVYIDFLDVVKTSPNYLSDEEKLDFYLNYLLLLKKNNKLSINNYFEGGNCMIRNNQGITIDSNGDLYKCYSLVGNKRFVLGNLNNIKNVHNITPMVTHCNNKKCEFYILCYGGCPFKKMVVYNELDNFCKYEFIKKMNSLIFLVQVTNLKNKEIWRAINDVEYFKIDF